MVPKLRAGGREGQREGESVRGTGTKAQCWPLVRGERRPETPGGAQLVLSVEL